MTTNNAHSTVASKTDTALKEKEELSTVTGQSSASSDVSFVGMLTHFE